MRKRDSKKDVLEINFYDQKAEKQADDNLQNLSIDTYEYFIAYAKIGWWL